MWRWIGHRNIAWHRLPIPESRAHRQREVKPAEREKGLQMTWRHRVEEGPGGSSMQMKTYILDKTLQELKSLFVPLIGREL